MYKGLPALKKPSSTLRATASFHNKPSIEEQFFRGDFGHSTTMQPTPGGSSRGCAPSNSRLGNNRVTGLVPPGSTPTARRVSPQASNTNHQRRHHVMENPLDAFEFPGAPSPSQGQTTRKSPFNQSDSDYMSVSDSLATGTTSASRSNNDPSSTTR